MSNSNQSMEQLKKRFEELSLKKVKTRHNVMPQQVNLRISSGRHLSFMEVMM